MSTFCTRTRCATACSRASLSALIHDAANPTLTPWNRVMDPLYGPDRAASTAAADRPINPGNQPRRHIDLCGHRRDRFPRKHEVELGARSDAQLAEDLMQVVLDSPWTDEQPIPDLGV